MTNKTSRFWLSWIQTTEDYRPLTDPPHRAVLGWWCSGYDAQDNATLCALVQAESLGQAKSAVKSSWPECPDLDVVWRFEDMKGNDWLPGDRFPMTLQQMIE